MRFGLFKKKKPVPVTGTASVEKQKMKKALPNSSSLLQNREEEIAEEPIEGPFHQAHSQSDIVLKLIEDIWFEHVQLLAKNKKLALDISEVQRNPESPDAMQKLKNIVAVLSGE